MTHHIIITDQNGSPEGAVILEEIQAQAVRLAFDMAANCADPKALDEIASRHIEETGVEGFGYVAAAALMILARDLMQPILECTDAAGMPLRNGIAKAAAQANADLKKGKN